MADKLRRIDNFTFAAMIVVALILDVVSLIPFIGAILAAPIFGLWFYLKGIGFINPRRFAAASLGVLVEAVPFLSWLPAITAAVIITVLTTRVEDRIKI